MDSAMMSFISECKGNKVIVKITFVKARNVIIWAFLFYIRITIYFFMQSSTFFDNGNYNLCVDYPGDSISCNIRIY